MRLWRALLVLGLVVSSSACGDDSSVADSSGPSASDESDLDPDVTTSSQLPGEDDLIEGLPEPPDEAPPPTITPPAGYDALCDMGLEMWPLVQSFGEPDQDVAEVAEWYEELVVVMQAHVPALPAGPVADDTQLLIDGLQLIVSVLGDFTGTFGEVMVRPEVEDRLSPVFDDGNVYDEAGDRWDEALSDYCGLVL